MSVKKLIGQRFGRLVVIDEYKKDKWAMCRCRCDCGTVKDIRRYSLLSGNTTSCGCIRRGDLTGRRFGRLIALEYAGQQGRKTLWRCRCDCGKEVIVQRASLISGNTKSCGCAVDPSKMLADCIDGTRLGAIRHHHRSDNTSGVTGVSWNKRRSKWEAYIRFQGKQIHLGLYDKIEDAAKARARAEEDYFQKFLQEHEKPEE